VSNLFLKIINYNVVFGPMLLADISGIFIPGRGTLHDTRIRN